jgi:NADH-quinone oxidoreductase subunit J
MTADSFIFWFLAIVTLCSGLAVVLMSNPVFSALCLAMTMVGVAGLFVTLNAYFIAGVQLIVYAGAVMVLFVMVLMLFDLRTEVKSFAKGKMTGAIKIGTAGIFAGLIAGAIAASSNVIELADTATNPVLNSGVDATKPLGQLLFTKYIFGFEALGILLLIIAVGTVSLARSKGGTHANR